MHTCCAPCSVYCIGSLRAEGIEPTVFWYNPNIHPYMEYKARRDCLKDYVESIGVRGIFVEDYGVEKFCKAVVDDIPNRCVKYCYRARLSQTVKHAKEHGFDAFTTTLLVSPYQKHEEIIRVCEELAEMSGVQFVYRDFRVGFREGSKRRESWGCICRNIVVAFFRKKSATKNRFFVTWKRA